MQFPLFPRAVELIYPGHSCTGGNTTFLALVRSIHVWIIVHSLWSPVEIASLWLVDPVSRCPVVPLSRGRLRASSRGWARYCPFRCPVVPFPLSRCPVVPLSRSRCPVGGLRVPLAGPGLVGGSHGMAVREQLLLESLCMLCPCGIRSADR